VRIVTHHELVFNVNDIPDIDHNHIFHRRYFFRRSRLSDGYSVLLCNSKREY
jgi:hypothetical protein